MADQPLSRRDFLKLSSASLLGLLLSNWKSVGAQALTGPTKGRVLATSLVVRDAPAFSGKKQRSVKRDVLLDLVEPVYGGEEGDYNRHWYRLNDHEYVYSGWVQPVNPTLNPAM